MKLVCLSFSEYIHFLKVKLHLLGSMNTVSAPSRGILLASVDQQFLSQTASIVVPVPRGVRSYSETEVSAQKAFILTR